MRPARDHKRSTMIFLAAAGACLCWQTAAGPGTARAEDPGRGAAAVNAGALNEAMRTLLETYPETRFHSEQGRARAIYGAPMTSGPTAREAARQWLLDHSAAFGAGILELEELWVTPVMDGRFTALAYSQYIEGLPVEYGNVRVLVLNEGAAGAPGEPRVVYAGSTLAPRIDPADVQIAIDGDTARQVVQAMPLFRGLREWSEPEMAIYQGEGEWKDPVVVWRFRGESAEVSPPRSKMFFVEVETGRLVHVRNEMYSSQITGSVKGWATQGVLPDTPANPPALHDIGEIRVRIVSVGGGSGFTARDGLFAISHSGTGSVPVATNVSAGAGYGGRWADVSPSDANPVQELLFVTPPGPAGFVLNPAPSESLTAQLNAFLGVTLAHNHVRDRAPDFASISVPLHVRTGETGSCDAYFQPGLPMLRFLNAGNGCPNTAYSTVIVHEYGHFVVNRLGLGQGGFGEGYSDTLAMLVYDKTSVGHDFFGPGTVLRDPPSANVQHPCNESGPNSGIHYCGQILAGVWWGVREQLSALYGSQEALDRTRDMQVAWSMITSGGTGLSFRQSAHPGTAIEVLTIDDDDGYLGNGTPHWDEICAAFAAHGIDCPPLDAIDVEFPQGVPSRLTIGEPFEVPVNIVALTGQPKAGGVQLQYRLKSSGGGGGTFVGGQVTQVGPDRYIATLPALSCGEFVDFYITAEAVGGETVARPPEAPETYFTARALTGASETLVFDDDFETDKGWTVWNDPSMPVPGGGHWERVIPIASFFANQPVQPGSAYRGQRCFLTENGEPGAAANAHDVDWGPTVLTSPPIDITGADFADLSFAWWHYTINGVPDDLEVDISEDDGATWVRIATYGNTSEPRRGQWHTARFDLLEYINPTPTLRIRFTVEDTPNDSLTESAIDDVRVITWTCPAGECYADCDGNEVLNINDFLCFIDAFASQDPYADCDGNGMLNINDFLCFIDEFAVGCP